MAKDKATVAAKRPRFISFDTVHLATTIAYAEQMNSRSENRLYYLYRYKPLEFLRFVRHGTVCHPLNYGRERSFVVFGCFFGRSTEWGPFKPRLIKLQFYSFDIYTYSHFIAIVNSLN